ncbi:MAG: ABC transporter permease [Acidimicrobiia bacterium]
MRLIVRLDRVRLPLWIIGLLVIFLVSATQVKSLYGSPAAIESYVSTVGDNPALVVFAGPGYGFDAPNIGVVLVNETSLWCALAAALMSMFIVNRHTRAEEDDERADLLRSTVVGRHATVVAALIVAVGANVVFGAAAIVTLLAVGYTAAGSIALVGSIVAMGLVFAAVTAVSAQIAGSGRGTLGLTSLALGLAFLSRGITDISTPSLSWLSPFGWAIGVRAYAGERWWTLAGLLVLAIALAWLSFALAVRRNLGSGMIPPRPGHERAAAWATTPTGLTLRLQRTSIAAWAASLFATAAVYGSVGNDVEKMLKDNPQLADYLAKLGGASVTDAYLSTARSMLALLVCGFATASILRNRSDETAGYSEAVLATPTSRLRWTTSHVIVTMAGTLAVLVMTGLGLGAAFGAVTHDASQVGRLLAATLATLPAIAVMTGVALVLFGWLPRASMSAWGIYAAVVVVNIFGEVLRLPNWLRQMSPFEHVPRWPAAPWHTTPIVVLTAVAITLSAAGLLGFRRRDLAVG